MYTKFTSFYSAQQNNVIITKAIKVISTTYLSIID